MYINLISREPISLWINGLCVYKRNTSRLHPNNNLSNKNKSDDDDDDDDYPISTTFDIDGDRSISPYPRLEV